MLQLDPELSSNPILSSISHIQYPTSFKSLPSLLEVAFSSIDSDNLLNSCNRSKYCDKILERAWQYELQRSISEYLPTGVYVSSEVGKMFSDDGIVDLYIREYGWAIELLVDGDKLKEHYERFKKGILFSK